MNFSIDTLKKLREETQVSVADCRQALEDAKGDITTAKKLLQERGLEKAKKKEGQETGNGIIASYAHATGKVGVLVEIKCQTDFVARTDDFKNLAKEITLQIAAMKPKDVKELLASEYIRDPKMTIDLLIKGTIAKLGENITIGKFTRMEFGE
jgi:elongation factor Ts